MRLTACIRGRALSDVTVVLGMRQSIDNVQCLLRPIIFCGQRIVIKPIDGSNSIDMRIDTTYCTDFVSLIFVFIFVVVLLKPIFSMYASTICVYISLLSTQSI